MPNSENDSTLKDRVLRFDGEAASFSETVNGPILNFASKDKEGLREWKVRLARAVQARRGRDWDPDEHPPNEHRYAVTLRFRFQSRPTKLDVDNYVKPVLDGLAAGLFLPENEDPGDLSTFAAHNGVDDSHFRTLLIRRLPDLPDGKEREDEEVHLFISRSERSREPDAAPAVRLR